MDNVRQRLTNYVNGNSTHNVVLIENASGGINSVMRSLQFNKGKQT